MSIKIERLNDTIQEEISKIIFTNVKDKVLKLVTITSCDTSNDLSYCKVYFTTLSKNKNEALKALNKAASFIRLELSKRVDIRHTPELKFIYDSSIEYGAKIDKLIEKIHETDNK